MFCFAFGLAFTIAVEFEDEAEPMMFAADDLEGRPHHHQAQAVGSEDEHAQEQVIGSKQDSDMEVAVELEDYQACDVMGIYS